MQPLRVAVLASSSAPGIEQLLGSPDRGVLYDVACVISSADSFADRRAVEEAGVLLIIRPPGKMRNLAGREDYDRETAEVLRAHGVDYVILVGYRYFVTQPLLESFPDRLLALYDGDLTLLDEDGERRYRDLHAVRRAIFAGDDETRSSLFFVNERPGARQATRAP